MFIDNLNPDAGALTQIALGIGASAAVLTGLAAPGLSGEQARLFRLGGSAIALAVCLHGELQRSRYDFAREVKRSDEMKFINDRRRQSLIVEQQVTPAITPQLLPLFDLSRLQDIDQHPCIAVFGPQGSGKSTLMRYFSDAIASSGKVYDMHNGPWSFPTFYKPAEILAQMQTDLMLVEQLQELPMEQKLARSPEVRLLDEAPVTTNGLKLLGEQKLLKQWVLAMATFTRKMRIRVVIGACVIAAEELGISAGTRNLMTAIFPGESGIALASTDTTVYGLGTKNNAELRAQLIASLQHVRRPGLIYTNGKWHPIAIPDYQPPSPVLAQSVTQPQDLLERCWQAETVPDRPALSPKLIALQKYLDERMPYPLIKVQQNWKFNGNRYTKDELIDLVTELGLSIDAEGLIYGD